ncbi:hypothetical protein [Dethiosulfatarculus sandiegensis]|uniref:Uncharacterized protein n=1 Tax=Dethiosulfatarculus sandiegensis TaxID=1429043 RepID=A0A0D2JQR6_9BACT|nr:hypothetical protein [Dethiosulfatarculus sandiegensis]KIX11845.1 hypothetical protein X474_22170 [Dethiosulfatarculus sandiegensis]
MIKILFFLRPLFRLYRSCNEQINGKSIVSILGIFVMTFLITIVTSNAIVKLTDDNAPLAFINAKTELISYIVARSELSNIPLYNVEIVSKENEIRQRLKENNCLFIGLIKPMPGARVTYRHSGEKIIIEIKSGAIHRGTTPSVIGYLHFYDDTQCPIHNRLIIRFRTPTVKDYFSNNARPLPIAGPAEIGRELGSPLMPRKNGKRTAGLMTGGTIRIFGRTNSFFGHKEVYPAQDASFVIPKGSRLTSISNSSITAGSPNSWYGSASIEKETFELSATTESKELRLYQPGRTRDSERFNISLFVQIFSDPSLALWSFRFVLFAFLFQVLLSLLEVLGLSFFLGKKYSTEPFYKEPKVASLKCSDDKKDHD